MAKAKVKDNVLGIEVPEMERKIIKVPVVGTSPMIVHMFSDKVKGEILDKQKGKANKGKAAKDPIADFVQSLYFMNGASREGLIDKLHSDDVQVGDDVKKYFKDIPLGFPASGFKKAAVSACRNVDGIPMTLAKGAFFVKEDAGGMVEIKYDKIIIRQDTVRLARGGVVDLRFRGELRDWSADLMVECNPRALTPEQVCNLIDTSGFAVGVAEWRPEKGGSNGMFMLRR